MNLIMSLSTVGMIWLSTIRRTFGKQPLPSSSSSLISSNTPVIREGSVARHYSGRTATAFLVPTSGTTSASKQEKRRWALRTSPFYDNTFVRKSHLLLSNHHLTRPTINNSVQRNSIKNNGIRRHNSNRNTPMMQASKQQEITTQHRQQEQDHEHEQQQPPLRINLLTIQKEELENLLTTWKQPKYRATQILNWIHTNGITDIDQMKNIPKSLKSLLHEHTTTGTLQKEVELVSKDGTIKRAYRLWDGQLIESVLMPYEDGRYTACISSQAGCAMGCVFCSTGQMGFARQLTSEEIFEQVAQFAVELKSEEKRLSNVVMMGMGEPLANYRNVLEAVKRMNKELGIGARKITVSTVGIVPNIRKLMKEDVQVRLAVSLHCATEEERSELLPANRRYGGLDELMSAVKEYIETTNRRITFEWALIENQNDTPDIARQLGSLLQRHGIRRDMAHINLIPLNPTGGYSGSPSGRLRVNGFVAVLEKEFGVKATPRVRRGIDIEAGCGQLKAAVKKREDEELERQFEQATNLSEDGHPSPIDELKSFISTSSPSTTSSELLLEQPTVGVYEDDEEEEEEEDNDEHDLAARLVAERIKHENQLEHGSIVEFALDDNAVDLDWDEDFEDPEYEHDIDINEAQRLMNLVQSTNPPPPSSSKSTQNVSISTLKKEQSDDELEKQQQEQQQQSVLVGDTTSITDEDSIHKAKRRRKKLIKNLKAIDRLKKIEHGGTVLNTEQIDKVQKEEMWRLELESVEHNLQ